MIYIVAAAIVLLVLSPFFVTWWMGRRTSDARADVAVVLGASVWDGEPSPVFRERINHAINLLREGRVAWLLLTGGMADRWGIAESESARRYVLSQGIDPGRILIETQSRNTLQNMIHAQRVMEANGLRTALIVSDPFHMRRAMAMARDIGIDCQPSPTPTTRYLTWRKKGKFLFLETFAYARYRMMQR